MSELIPDVEWADLVKIVRAGRIEELKSCWITFDGVPIIAAIIPHGDVFTKDYPRIQADHLGMRSNIPGGKDPAELLAEIEAKEAAKTPKDAIYLEQVKRMAKAREARRVKREAQAVTV